MAQLVASEQSEIAKDCIVHQHNMKGGRLMTVIKRGKPTSLQLVSFQKNIQLSPSLYGGTTLKFNKLYSPVPVGISLHEFARNRLRSNAPCARHTVSLKSVVSCGVLALSGLFIFGHAILAQNLFQRTAEYTVQSGDTLWGVSERFDPMQNPQVVIAWIEQHNSALSSDLVPGQVITIPVPEGTAK